MKHSLKQTVPYLPILLLCVVAAGCAIPLLTRAGLAADLYGHIQVSAFAGAGLWLVLGISLLVLVAVEIFSFSDLAARRRARTVVWVLAAVLFCAALAVLIRANAELAAYALTGL